MTISSLIFEMPIIIISIFYVLAEWASSPLPGWLLKVINFPLEFILSFSYPLRVFGVDVSFFETLMEKVIETISDTPVAIFILLWCFTVGGIFTIIFAVVDIIDRVNFIT